MTEVRPVNALALIPIRLIDPSPDNPRARLEDLDELAASLRSVGQLQPLVVQRAGPVRFRVRMGHRRLAAARLAGMDEVLCFIAAPADRARFLAEAITENGQRRDLNPIEIAHALTALVECYGTQEQVARVAGRSKAWVSRHLGLLELEEQTQELVRRGALSPNVALDAAANLRRDEGSRLGRPVGRKTRGHAPHHFGVAHPLAIPAAEACDAAGHTKVGRVGMIACGECWEQAIRADARRGLAEEVAAARDQAARREGAA